MPGVWRAPLLRVAHGVQTVLKLEAPDKTFRWVAKYAIAEIFLS
jgi:hypothetical protein